MRMYFASFFLTIILVVATTVNIYSSPAYAIFHQDGIIENSEEEEEEEFVNQNDSISKQRNGLKPGYKFMLEFGPQFGIGKIYRLG